MKARKKRKKINVKTKKLKMKGKKGIELVTLFLFYQLFVFRHFNHPQRKAKKSVFVTSFFLVFGVSLLFAESQ